MTHGMNIFNDSKATNYDAAAVALEAVPGPIALLAGGQTKEGNAHGWLELLRKRASSITLFGRDREMLRTLILDSGFTGPVSCHIDLVDAVPSAIQAGEQLNAVSLLLSPACASFDQYQDFEARGDHFRKIVNQYPQ